MHTFIHKYSNKRALTYLFPVFTGRQHQGHSSRIRRYIYCHCFACRPFQVRYFSSYFSKCVLRVWRRTHEHECSTYTHVCESHALLCCRSLSVRSCPIEDLCAFAFRVYVLVRYVICTYIYIYTHRYTHICAPTCIRAYLHAYTRLHKSPIAQHCSG
jgi:hypothetical protein